ncbi:hypothetical protein [Qingshengfaniella alkalisoli]|uniref:Uncharacterized protein n=1 Tax=Qingshengfaniella alkalisoli TaxID=2599296 RepID=A0A5B8IA86_9RHOB|nr:hypothetical protein [Qingshengfaniella alkalisoli]QDY70116.1 hypothetical protein FPZ52_11120 [Qingshengfaniella alkalisoli]
MGDLELRMRLHVPGQVTWPMANTTNRCTDCRHFFTGDNKMPGKGRCDLVRKHSGGRDTGVQFVGEEGIACTMFSAGVHPRNKDTEQ